MIWNADDGRHAYFVSARDLDHAKQILHAAGVELHDPSGTPRAVHHEHVCHPTMWMEIDPRTAKKRVVHGTTRRLSKLREGRYVRVSRAT